jgi:hypothetical protein
MLQRFNVGDEKVEHRALANVDKGSAASQSLRLVVGPISKTPTVARTLTLRESVDASLTPARSFTLVYSEAFPAGIVKRDQIRCDAEKKIN